MLAQRIYAIALGDEDLNDHKTLRADPALRVAVDQPPDDDPDAAGASMSTLHRLENRADRKSLIRMAEAFVDDFIASYDEPPESLILDFDATDSEIHGHQEGRFFHGDYDCYCYLPLYVFCGDSLLTAWLRPSRIDAARHSRAALKLLVRKLRATWPKVHITIRADRGICRWRLLRWCDSTGIGDVIGLARNSKLEGMAAELMDKSGRGFETTGEKQRHFETIHDAAATWDRPRRVIVKAEHTDKGPNPRFVVTNVPGDAEFIYDEVNSNVAKRRIGSRSSNWTCSRTGPVAAGFWRTSFGCSSARRRERLRQIGLKGTAMERAQAGTIRLKLLKIASRVVVSVRRVVFHLSRSYPYRALFEQALANVLQCAQAAARASPP